MMTRAQIRRLIIDFVSVLLVSIIVILTGVFMSLDKEELRLQRDYQNAFKDLIVADSYEELEHELLASDNGINHVYIAYNSAKEPIGYIADVSVFDSENNELHSLFAVNADGSSIIAYKRVGDEAQPIFYLDSELEELSSQVISKPMPISLAASEDEDVIVSSEYDPPPGLHDGIYYAQTMSKDSKGYIDYVEIEIENGRIKRVKWDGINIDPTTGSRNTSSLTGAYVISGKNWATQSYNVCHALIELQDVSRLAMKSDGTTEIIPDVTCNISCFVNLAQECLDNSKVGFTKDDYFAQLSILITQDGGYVPDITDANGFMVYPFQNMSVFQRPGSDNLIDMLTVYETTLVTSADIDAFENEISDDTPVVVTPSDDTHNGAEDGLVDDASQSIITDSIDGIPLSEVNTFIIGIPNEPKKSSYFITSVNETFKFFKNYLNWIA